MLGTTVAAVGSFHTEASAAQRPVTPDLWHQRYWLEAFGRCTPSSADRSSG